MKARSIALSAGEASGDLHGSYLVRELRKRLGTETSFWGGGGALMQKSDVELVVNTSGGGTIGVLETLASLPGFLMKYRKLRSQILQRKPDLFIPIDFGAFNTRLAKIVVDNGIDVVYYIPPGSWRRNVRSADALRACGGKAVTPFPWSYEGLEAQGIDVRWPGHPLLDIVKPTLSREDFYRQHSLSGKVVSLFAGSRAHELSAHLPILVRCADFMKRALGNVSFVVGAAAGASELQQRIDLLSKKTGSNARLLVLENSTYDCMAHSDLALVTSGTATLEAAILGVPMVIFYRGTSAMRFEYLMRKAVVESYIGLPNLILQELIVPEMIAAEVNAESLAAMALCILEDKEWQKNMRADYARMRKVLGGEGALARAADAVVELAGFGDA